MMWRRLLDLLAGARRPLVFLDFETAGLAGAPPVEFAALVYSPWDEQVGDEETRRAAALAPPGLTYAVQMRLDPLQPIHPGASRVHRIRDDDVRGKARAYNDLEVAGFFQGYASGDATDNVGPAIWCGHNASGADVPWATRWGYLPDAELDVVDTMRLGRRLAKEHPFPLAPDIVTGLYNVELGNLDVNIPATAHGLDAYAGSLVGLHVALTGARHEAHGAMADCLATARVLCRMLEMWDTLWPPGRQDLPPSSNLAALLACLDAPPAGQVGHDGWLAEDETALAGTRYVWARGKHRGEPAEVDPSYRQWVQSLPRRPTGVDGEQWCSQQTADILRGLRPVAVAR